MEAAFFDLDKTIIAKSSVLAFGGPLYREGLISRRAIARSMYAQVVYMLVGADEAKMEKVRESMLRLTKGWDQQHVAEIVRETLEATIQPIIYAEALDLIREHNAAGRRTVIISSSPFEVVAPLAEYLGVDDAIATRAQIDDAGRYTGELDFYAYGEAKASAIREKAELEDIDLAASYAYSDSITDLPMLEAVGHPVVVNPDRDLARRDRARVGGPQVRAARAVARPHAGADDGAHDRGEQRRGRVRNRCRPLPDVAPPALDRAMTAD